jgi:hypothetical protein
MDLAYLDPYSTVHVQNNAARGVQNDEQAQQAQQAQAAEQQAAAPTDRADEVQRTSEARTDERVTETVPRQPAGLYGPEYGRYIDTFA